MEEGHPEQSRLTCLEVLPSSCLKVEQVLSLEKRKKPRVRRYFGDLSGTRWVMSRRTEAVNAWENKWLFKEQGP